MSKQKELKGKVFNRLKVLEYVGNSKWICECQCGNKTIVSTTKLKTGHTKSCGCLKKETGLKKAKIMQEKNKKYKMLPYDEKQKRIQRIWYCMQERCRNENSYCGKKKIKVCEEWQEFENFYNWAIKNGFDENKPKRQCTIDRINNNGNYEPNNCRFVTHQEQQWNKNNTHYVIFENNKKCVGELIKKYDLSKNDNIYYYLKRGLNFKEILERVKK